jgi:hypothetical protein
METWADEQQWRFQSLKHAMTVQERKVHPDQVFNSESRNISSF